MIERQYFTYRPFLIGKSVVMPHEVIKQSFTGVESLTMVDLCSNFMKDGRKLAYVEVDTDELPFEIIAEAMAAFAYHIKTSNSALDFAKYATEIDRLYLDGDEIKGWEYNHTPIITISMEPEIIFAGDEATFTAVYINRFDESDNPIFQWYKNDVAVGNPSESYTDTELMDGDLIKCAAMSDDDFRATDITYSNEIVIDLTT